MAKRSKRHRQDKHVELQGEAMFRKVFEQCPDAIFLGDAETGAILNVNPAGCELMDMPREELLGLHHTRLHPKEEAERYEAVFKEHVQQGEGTTEDLYIQRPSGELVPVDMSVSVMEISGRRIMQGVFRDITSRKQAEEALRDSERRYRHLVELSFDGVAIHSGGQIVFANSALATLLGAEDSEELLGRTITEFLPPEYRKVVEDRAVQVREEGEAPLYEERFLRLDGSVVDVEVAGVLTTHEGQPAVQVVVRDITARKWAEEALRESEERYRTLFDTLPVGLELATVDGQVVMSNKAMHELMGYTTADVSRMNQSDLYVNPGHRDLLLERLERDGFVRDFETELKRKDGTAYHANLTVTLCTLDGREVILTTVQDITERRQMGEELRKLSRAVEQSSSTVVITDTEGNIEYVNPRFREITGYSQEEVIGKNPRLLKSGAQPADFYEELWRTIKDGAVWRGDFVNKKKDGELYWERAAISPVKDSHGTITHFVKVAEDISEQKRAEEALRDSEERYRRVVQDMPALVCRFLPDGTLSFVNEHYCRYFHKRREELEGQSFFEFIPEEVHEAVRSRYSSLTAESPTITYEHQVLAPDGTLRWQRWTDRALFDEEGRPVEYQSIGQDITERKQAREALEESEQKFRSLAEQSPNMIFINRDGAVVYANEQCQEVMGYTREELYSPDFDFFTLVAPESRDSINENYARHLRGEEVPPIEYKLVTKEGEIIEAILATRLITYEGQNAILGVVTDITERKRAEGELSGYAHELAVRVKELNCLYAIAALVQMPGVALEEILQGVVELIPPAWRHPEITCARLAIDGQEYRTDNYEETAWAQTADIVIRGERAGTLQVGFLEERPASDEGPFGQEERLLIHAIAERVGRVIERMRAEEALRQSTRELTLRNQIARVFLTTTDEEMYGEVLQVVLEVLESKYGVFGYIDEKGALVCPSMTRDIWDRCQIPDKDIVFPRETWGGIWGQALVEAKSFYSNGPMRVPEGHIPIERVVAVPIIHQGEAIGILEVGNKETDYDERDQGLLEAIAGYIAPVLRARLERDREERERRRAEQALRESEERFRTMYSQSPISVELYDADGKLVDANPACLDLFGVDSVEELRGFDLFEDPNMPSEARAHIERGEAVAYENVFDFDLVTREGLYKTSESGTRFIDVRITPLKGSEGVPGGFLVHVQDITERKRAEEELRETTRLLETILDHSHVLVAYMDPEFNFVRVNRVYAEADGRDPSFFSGKNHFDLYPNEENRAIFQSVLETREPYVAYARPFEYAEHPERGVTYWDWTLVPIEEDGGTVTGLVLTLADVTERIRGQQELWESEERYRDLVESIDDVIYGMDANGVLTYVSPAVEAFLGYTPSEVVGRPFAEFISPEDVQSAGESFQRILSGDAIGDTEYRAASKSGEMRWIRVSSRPVFGNDHVVGVRGVLSDITERKRAEDALRESEARWRSLTETSPDHILTLGTNLNIQFANFASPGLTVEELVGTPLYAHVEKERQAEVRAILEGVLKNGEPATYETVYYTPAGDVIHYESRVVPRRLPDSEEIIGLTVSARDITDRKHTEQALQEAIDAADTARCEEEERRHEAERRRQIAESLADVMTVLNSNQSLDEVLDYIAMRTAELLGNQAVGIYRLEDDQKLAIQAARGLLVAYATGREIPIGHAALRRAMASREAVPIPHLARRPTAEGAPTREALQETLARTWGDLYLALLAVPIIVGEELYGAIALYYSEPREFPEEEIELATVFGDQVALAIENARLRDQVREAAAVAERERLARDLHDAVTQTLFSASLIAEALPRVWERDPDRAREGLKELRSLTQGALAEMRTLLLELRPAGLTEKPLGELLGHLTQAMTGRSRVPMSLTVEGDSHVPDELQIALYRIAQEALNNVAKHAEANQVSVRLHCDPGRVRLRIRDDGRGFDPEDALPDQLGMGIMRERAKSVGATLKITSRPGQGTEVAVDWQEGNGRPSDD